MGPRIGGVGAILVDDVFKVAALPHGTGLPEPGTKQSASGSEVDETLRRWDSFVGRTKHSARVGGPVPIALTYAHALGAESRFVGGVGRDGGGSIIRAFLAEHGLSTAYLQDRAGASGRSLLWLDPRGARSVLFSDATLTPVDPQQVQPTFLADLDLLHIDGRESPAAYAFASAMRARGRPVIYDVGNWKPHSAKLLNVATHVQFPLRSAAAYAGRSTHSLSIGNDAGRLAEKIRRAYGLVLVVLTDGENGAVFSVKGLPPRILPSYRVDAVDTNGAGDVFAGVMGWAIANKYPVTQAVSLANAAAGWKCQHDGHVMPTLRTISTFMQGSSLRSSMEVHSL